MFVHFWVSWCGPCLEEMPALQKMATLIANGPIQLVMINTAEDDDTVFGFLSSFAPDTDSLIWTGMVRPQKSASHAACLPLTWPIRKVSFATRHQGGVRGISRNTLNSCAAC